MTDRIDTAKGREWLEGLRNRPLSASDRASLMVTFSVILDSLDAERARAEKAEAERDQALTRAAAAAMEMREQAARVASLFGQGSQGIKTSRAIETRIRSIPTDPDAEAALQRVVDETWNEAVEACALETNTCDDLFLKSAILALKRPEASHE